MKFEEFMLEITRNLWKTNFNYLTFVFEKFFLEQSSFCKSFFNVLGIIFIVFSYDFKNKTGIRLPKGKTTITCYAEVLKIKVLKNIFIIFI